MVGVLIIAISLHPQKKIKQKIVFEVSGGQKVSCNPNHTVLHLSVYPKILTLWKVEEGIGLKPGFWTPLCIFF